MLKIINFIISERTRKMLQPDQMRIKKKKKTFIDQ